MMKATGIVRKVDDLGRIVIPKEIRRTLGITEDDDALEIFVEEDQIILRKYVPGCQLCGKVDNVEIIDGIRICGSCAEKIRNSKSKVS